MVEFVLVVVWGGGLFVPPESFRLATEVVSSSLYPRKVKDPPTPLPPPQLTQEEVHEK